MQSLHLILPSSHTAHTYVLKETHLKYCFYLSPKWVISSLVALVQSPMLRMTRTTKDLFASSYTFASRFVCVENLLTIKMFTIRTETIKIKTNPSIFRSRKGLIFRTINNNAPNSTPAKNRLILCREALYLLSLSMFLISKASISSLKSSSYKTDECRYPGSKGDVEKENGNKK